MASYMKHLRWKVITLGRYCSHGVVRLSSVAKGSKIPTLNIHNNNYLELSRTARNFSIDSVQLAKRIDVSAAENKTVVEGKQYDSEKKRNLRSSKAPTGCPLCEFQDTLTYKDVLILHQFLSPDGRILPRHVTGMCRTMQWKLRNILYQSYSAGLLPVYKPDLPIAEDPKTYSKDYKWRKNNVYYEDFSIENPL